MHLCSPANIPAQQGCEAMAILSIKYLLPHALSVCCSEGVVQAELHGCIGHDLQQGDGDAIVQPTHALLSHNASGCVHQTAIYLQNS